jgi:hypothetical protein
MDDCGRGWWDTKPSITVGKNPLSVKREFADQDDTESRRIHELLQTVNRSQSEHFLNSILVQLEFLTDGG